jgi:hypothetical protein
LVHPEADPRHPRAWNDAAVEEKFESLFDAEERAWIVDEFARTLGVGDRSYEFTLAEAVRLAVKFGPSLKRNEELYEYIRENRRALKAGRSFDFEPSLAETETLTTPRELIFYMQWLKARGCPAQLVAPNLGFRQHEAYPAGREALDELEARVKDLAAVARHFQAILSIHAGGGQSAAVLETLGKSTVGKLNFTVSGELQLQLFDVLAAQPAGSPERALFDRMVARAEWFAARGAFGDSGALFLRSWLGYVVGSRDVDSPDGDRSFFQEKLDHLPAAVRKEVQARNARYIDSLAENLIA